MYRMLGLDGIAMAKSHEIKVLYAGALDTELKSPVARHKPLRSCRIDDVRTLYGNPGAYRKVLMSRFLGGVMSGWSSMGYAGNCWMEGKPYRSSGLRGDWKAVGSDLERAIALHREKKSRSAA